MLHALNDKFSFAANGVIKYSSFLQHEILVDFSLLEQFLLDFNNSYYFLSFVRCFSFYIKTKSIQGLLFVQRRIEFMLDSFLGLKHIFTAVVLCIPSLKKHVAIISGASAICTIRIQYLD